MSNDFDKFVDAFIEHAMKTTGMTREELLKGWSVDGAPAPVIEVGDVVKCSSELASPNNSYEVTQVKEGGYVLRPLYNLHVVSDSVTLIRKGPKVRVFRGVAAKYIDMVKGAHTSGLRITLERDKEYTLTVTEEDTK